MLKFVEAPQQYPDVREAKERRDDFDEIYGDFQEQVAEMQAARCSQCGVPFCQVHCPVQNNIPDWLKLTAEGRMEEAYRISSATNTFPEICGRICPQDRLCEGNCVINKGFGAVTIGAVEKYITEMAWEQGWVKPPMPARETGKSVGIIGAGPAGMAAAEMLRREGFAVTIYDRYDRAGGLMIYGIPGFKLEKWVVERRRKLFEEAGIKFELNCDVGRDMKFGELKARHDAVLIATGVYKAKSLAAPGVGLDNIVPALDYLVASNKKGLGDRVADFESGRLNAEGRAVVVIGGGDTAMDCVRTAVRQGARSVTCLYRRDRENMPGSRKEVKNAEEEGVKFMWLSAPKAFDGNGKVEKIICARMGLAAGDESGRQAVYEIEGAHFTLEADMVINALGFDPEDLPEMFGEAELKVRDNGTLATSGGSLYKTSMDGVFAAGDIVRGASLVVWAIKDGRDAAKEIMERVGV